MEPKGKRKPGLRGIKKGHKSTIYNPIAPPTSPELNPLYDSLRKIYDLSQILRENTPKS